MVQKRSIFVTSVTPDLIEKLRHGLIDQGFEITQPAHTHFSGKKKGVSCTLYLSLKLTVQGKEMEPFIEFYLEPEVLKEFHFTHQAAANVGKNVGVDIDERARIGVDEAGKGDFFGPLCVAAVFADKETIAALLAIGVRDSKTLSDSTVLAMAKKIKTKCQHSLIRLNPAKYNELYAKFGNLNSLLAWGHATAIDHLSKLSGCTCVIIDQFAHERVVQKAIEKKNITIDLTQRHKGESDVVVAAASILARAAFLEGLKALSLEAQIELPKGASSKTIQVGKQLVAKWGPEVLIHVSKQHFRTTQQVL